MTFIRAFEEHKSDLISIFLTHHIDLEMELVDLGLFTLYWLSCVALLFSIEENVGL